MTLDKIDLQVLEKIIDGGINNIPTNIQLARTESVKKQLMLNNDYDFVMGQFFGSTIRAFTDYYLDKLTKTSDSLNRDSINTAMEEATEIISKSIPKVRHAIFDCG